MATLVARQEQVTADADRPLDESADSQEGHKLCNAILVCRNEWSRPKQMLEQDFDFASFRDHFGKSALHYAIRVNAPVNFVDDLIEKKGFDVNLSDKDGWTPLHLLVRLNKSCDLDLLKCLLRHGANANLKDNGGQTPLHVATIFGASGEVFDSLLAFTGDANARNLDNETPLVIAAKDNTLDFAAIRVLLKYGGNPLLRDATGRNALDWGREKGREDLVRVMREYRLKSDSVPKPS